MRSRPDPDSARPRRDPRPLFSGSDALSWLFLCRLLLILALLSALSLAESTHWLPRIAEPFAARQLLLWQALLILASGLMIVARWPRRDQQVQLAVYLDILFAVVLIHLSGGVALGFGLLPAIALIWGALLLEGRQSLLFAALASLGVIAQQVYAELHLDQVDGSYLEAGLLGILYFSVAALVHVLARRLRATEQLAARRKVDLADLSQLNEYVIERLTTGVLVLDGERRIRLLNAAAQRLLARSGSGARARAGKALARVAPALLDWLDRAITCAPSAQGALELNGRHLRPELHLLGEGRPTGALIYLRDEQDLLRQAQEVNLASLGRLSASVAHNIRNPLAAIAHASQLLAESTQLEDQDQQLLAIIRRNTQRLDEIVNSVLELSHRHRAEPRRFDLKPWLIKACREYRDSHRLDDQVLELELTDAETLIEADPRHLHQILNNLCDNALEHGKDEQGRCRMRWTLETDPTTRVVRIRLCDTGPGIPLAQQETIFEPCFTTARTGTGLGLYAARALAEANGIRLEYSDAPHQGSCFTLTFGD